MENNKRLSRLQGEYYLKDGRGPFQTVQEAMDALGLGRETRPQHNRWSRLSTQLKDTIQRRPKAVGTVSLKAKFQPRDKVRFSNRATKYITADLRKRTRTIVDMFYDPVKKCCFYELGARGNGTLGYFFRSLMLLPANGNQHTIGRPPTKWRYNRRTKLLFKPPNQNLGGKGMLPYDLPLPLNRRWEYWLKEDGRGPYSDVQAAMDALGLPKDKRPQHQRWDRLSTQLKEQIQRRPKVFY